jgi:UDP-glucose 4-epimerase
VLMKALIGCLINDVPAGIYNVVDKNIQILDIVDVLKEIYPTLEFIFINQHLDLRQMRVERDSAIRKFVDFENNLTLRDELNEFKKRFSF